MPLGLSKLAPHRVKQGKRHFGSDMHSFGAISPTFLRCSLQTKSHRKAAVGLRAHSFISLAKLEVSRLASNGNGTVLSLLVEKVFGVLKYVSSHLSPDLVFSANEA